VTRDQMTEFAKALARGEEHRRQIALTIGRDMLSEADLSASPYGIGARLKDRLTP
jgi:hypothetical protein